ncbi:MAG: CD225/dispanin family protein [Prolixibacteraceae bacterium]|jgi:hypothetical protein|nr:CD225/dispanin family protein [Prolixibacteraceae bacterium]MDD4754536.1 CD225/dispanin family protein [Prolixibacteraceae bacterium]NLO02000.1 CD225/dispanin family protein [Bacteroidales bacterium]
MNDQPLQQQQDVSSIPPPNYLVWAILTTILCCLPFGIISIIYAAQVNSKWQAGDIPGAESSSKNAKIWAWVAFGAGLAAILLWIILLAFGALAGFGLEALDSLDL